MTDPDLYEAHYHVLIDRIADLLVRAATGYLVDQRARDWTRLFRCPLVVRDGREEFDYLIRVYHLDRLNLQTFKVKPRRQPPVHLYEPVAEGQRATAIKRATRFLNTCRPAVSGCHGHDTTFAVACTLFKEYGLSYDDVRGLIDAFNRRCDPPWSERELDHKVGDAARKCGAEVTL